MPTIYTVTTTADSGAGSLRQAILDANATASNDEIIFDSSIFLNGVSTIALGAAFPAIAATSGAGSLTISGPGAASLIIDAQQGNYSIFKVNTGGNLTISGVTVTGANLSGSGGAFSNSGALNIYSSTISGNSVTGNGGGINNNGSLNIFNSTISGNIASGASSKFDNYGGGINNSGTLNVTNSTMSGNTGSIGGGINNSQGGTLTVTNSTLSGNTATAYGGGMNNYNALTVTNCTFSGNSAQTAGGLQNNGTLNIANTIIANSPSGNDYFGGGSVGTNLNNLVEDGTLNDTTGNSSGSGDISGDPLLSPLANNGGPTFTMALGANSHAISAGDATVSNAASIFGLDQRGYTRSTTAPSIGAYEYNGAIPLAPTVDSISSSTGSAAGGTSITITGTNLAGATAVTIGGTAATNLVVNGTTSITVTTPAHTAGAVSIDVTTVGGTNTANNLYTYRPTVTPSTSNLAINATTLTITGTGFDPIAANNLVSLSSGTGTVTSATATQLTVTFNTAPKEETLGAEVTTNGISSGIQVQVGNIVLAPVITSISPAAGPTAGGNTITINGRSFVNVTGVTVGGIAIATTNYTVVNGQKITATMPPGIFGPANILVTTVDGTNSTTANTIFNYTAGAFDTPAEPFAPAFPHAISINAPGSTVGASASFTVTFNQPVTGVDAADFTLSTTGTVAGGTISSITGSGATRTVQVSGITGAGTLGLNLVNLPTITALPSFAAQATVATGSKPASVILGDVNGDGELDIITANYNSANVSVLLGNGNGSFKTQATLATGTNPFAVKLGDVDGDGLVDIITANKGSNNTSVLLGNGNGTFKSQTTFATGTSPRSVALGDVNGDGTLDIITANQGSSNVSVLLGTGNGSFAGQAVDTLNAAQSYSVALGDVNGDGKLDIVAGNRAGSNGSLLLGNGDGTFQASQVFDAGGAQCFVALGDVNGDGKLDILIARAGNDVALVIGNGNGTFQGPQTVGSGTNPRSLSLADVNGDGRLDILTANFGSTANNASVLLGNGNGTFQGAANFATGTNSRSAALGDVNGDGRLDIVAANFNSDNASVILGTGGSAMFATFSPQQTFATGNGAQSQALGDLNGDGKLDMVTANGQPSTASVLLGNGNGTFKDQTTVATGTSPRCVTLGDVNDDGRLDLITANRDSNTASVLLGNGNGTFQTQTTFTTGGSPRSVALGDVNGDGRLDIITANNNDNNASVLLGNGNGTFQAQATFATGSSPRAVALGDVDGDGKLDIITANNGDASASASVLLGNGNGTFQGQQTFATGSNPRALTLGDVNGDGNLDIITANFAGNSVSVLLGNGNGTFQTQATFATNRPYSVSLGDLNGDGRLDIITASYSSDTVRVLLGNGNGTFAAEVIFAAGDGPLSVALGDLNGDGRLDITTANFNSGNASVLLNSLAFTGQTATVDAIAPTAPTITKITDDAEPITGTIAPGGSTNDTSILLTGSAEAASTVSIYNGSDLLGTTTADSTGAWSYTANLSNGTTTYDFNATATDAVGNISPASAPNYSVTVDTVAPAAPTITSITDDAAPITGTIAPGGFTNDTSLLLTGTAEAASTVSIYNGSSLLGTTTSDTTTGAWSYSATGLANGSTYAFNATATDAAGNVSNASSPQQTFTTETGPFSVALGDVNGDGRLDIITANSASNNASVLLGNGNGTFQGQQTFATGSNPNSVALGDVNGDGRFDIITANSASDNASVLLGNGNSTFQGQQTFATGSNPNSVALGDVNGDGRLDIITANYNGNTAGLLLGNGDGTFQTQATFATGSGPNSLALGDVNGDGTLDIITANLGSTAVSVLLGNGNGTFQGQQTFATGANPFSVSMGDVNGDGRLDIITANLGSANVSVLLGNGNGTFGPKTDFSTGTGSNPASVALGDLNGDGRLDIIAANAYSANVSVLLGNGNGSFQEKQTLTTDAGPVSVALGDVNGDGRLDIITANLFSANVSVLLDSLAFTGQRVSVDTTAPAAPTITSITDNVTPITGTIAPGGFTNDTSLDLTGTAEAASTVSIYNGSTLLGTTTADNTTGAWSYSATGLFGGSTYVFQATATDAAGNVSAASSYSVTVDTTAPTAPTITSITDDAVLNTGTIAPGGLTNDTSLDLTGTAEAASTVSIYNGSELLGTTTANGTGVWSYTASGLTNGTTYAFNATATDAAGNISPASSPNYSLTVDTAAPTAPTITSITDNAAPITGTITPGGFTNDTSLDLTGTAEAASTVSIYNGSTLLGTTTANNATGAWSYTASGLTNGTTYAFNATATDAAGNISPASSPNYSLTVDTAAPTAPTITSITDDAAPITGSIAPGGFTNDTSLDLTGTAEAASSVSIYNGSTLLGTTTADTTTGAWSYSANGLSGGSTYAFKTTATDAAGNISSASSSNYSVTVDTAAPAAPTITSITDNVTPITGSIAPGGVTNDTSLDLTGTAEAASSVSIYNGSTLLGTATADTTTGAWSYSANGLSGGSTYAFKATATDAAGNISSASSSNYSVTVDTAAPAAPTITSITDDAAPITGSIAPGGVTNDTSLDLTGTAEVASSVSIYNGSELLGTTTADNTTGAWSYGTTGLSNGTTYVFKATATDAAGNISSASSTNYSVTVDTTSPSPSPSGITSANSKGRYGFGSTINLQVSFTETVYVTGSPTLLLETGSTDRAALYKGGSGTNTLSFDYTVQLGDSSSDLEISSSAALSLQGGSIKDAAGNNAILTLPAPGAPGSLGANAALVIDDNAPSAGTTFTTTQGASGLINKPVIINQITDPLTGGSVISNTLLVFNNATIDSNATSGLQLRLNSNGSNPAATVISASDLMSFKVSPSISSSGNISNLDVNGIRASAQKTFESTIQEVDLNFPESPIASGWNSLYKKNKNGNYFLFNYDPLSGLGGILLDRNNNGSIDGARLYLKDGALGDFDETVNGEIDDPIGFTTLTTTPTLRISNDKKGFSVEGVEGTGLWISLNLSSFSSPTQSNLEIYNNNTNENYGAIGATLGSGPTGSQAIYLAAGNTIGFRYRNGAGQVNSNPALSISSTATGFSLGLDADLNGTYTDLMLDITSSITASSPANLAIARKQLSSSDTILDLTSIAATGIQLTLDISTDCGMRNRFGFVKLDPVTGSTYQVAGVSENDGAAFRRAVLSQFIDPYINSGKSHGYNQSIQTITWDLTSSAAGYYAPVMITETGEVLTFGASTASDGRQHVKLLGDNTFGFEDLLASQGSDWDFNDTKIRVSVA